MIRVNNLLLGFSCVFNCALCMCFCGVLYDLYLFIMIVYRDGLSILATLCKQKFGGPRP